MRPLALAVLAALLAACATAPTPRPPPSPIVPQPAFTAVPWQRVPGWERDDPREAFEAFRTGCAVLRTRAPWQAACTEALASAVPGDAARIRAFFERRFQPWQVTTTDAAGVPLDTGQITGYFEPLLQGSRKRDARFTVPLYGVPDDLVTIELGDLYPPLKGERVRGRLVGRRVVPYPDRAAISRGEGPRGKELVFVDSAVDAFFLQVQGSGRIRLPSGETIRLAYADVNGHPYRSIGRVLVERGDLTLEEATAPGLTAWIAQHPDRADELLNANPSYVFFREEPIPDPARGPRGSLGVPLTPGRSIAIDPRNLPLGAPMFLATTGPDGAPLERLVMAQDTGGAIRGVVRADFFTGLGPAAGDLAGRLRGQGRLWVLWPREAGPPTKP